jgi:hypothetical protein
MMSSVLLYTFISTELFDHIAKVGAQSTQKIALIIIPLFLMFELGVSVVKFLMGGKGDSLNLNKFFSYILIWFFTFQYLPVMTTLGFFVDAIDEAVYHGVDPDGEGMNLQKSMMDMGGQSVDVLQVAILLEAGKKDEAYAYFQEHKMTSNDWQNARKLSNTKELPAATPEEPGFMDIIAKLFMSPFGILGVLLESFNSGLMGLLRIVIEVLSAILTTFLIAVGPLAIAFNMMPFGINDGVLKNWFGTWFSIRCWAITMTLIDFMQKTLIGDTDGKFWGADTQNFMENLGGISLNVVLSICFVLLYILTPFLTNLYTKGSGGQFLSLFVGTVAMAAKAASKVAGGGGGGGK